MQSMGVIRPKANDSLRARPNEKLKACPPSKKAAHKIIRMYFWTMQRDGQIYYTGVRQAITKFYAESLKPEEGAEQ